jgi:hypothetical protein
LRQQHARPCDFFLRPEPSHRVLGEEEGRATTVWKDTTCPNGTVTSTGC